MVNEIDGPLEQKAAPGAHGYRGSVACQAAGISYRQLDYWARTGLVVPSIRMAAGSGSARLYSFRDILLLKVIKRFLSAGVSLQNIRAAVEHLTARGTADLSTITLMSDGSSIYECTNSDEVYDLLLPFLPSFLLIFIQTGSTVVVGLLLALGAELIQVFPLVAPGTVPLVVDDFDFVERVFSEVLEVGFKPVYLHPVPNGA